MEIAKNGWIRNSLGRPDYDFVLKLIKTGKLKARNYALKGEKPYFLVRGADIVEYNKKSKKWSRQV